MKTRQKILLTARKVFNAERFGKVTTASLAEAVGITEGNLWYHFKTKRDLLDALTEDFISDAQARFVQRPTDDGDVIIEYAEMLSSIAEEMRKWRFLYRDQADYGEHTDVMLDALPRIYKETYEQFSAYLEAMIDQDLMFLNGETLEELITTMVMSLRYHLEFLRERGAPADTGSGAVNDALRHHKSIIAHCLSPSALARLSGALSAFAPQPT